MNTSKLPTVLAGALLVVGLGAMSSACVADRPSRNGVFNENQYLRKDFLIEGTDTNGNSAGQDPGWLMRATVTETSSPNLLGSAAGADIFAGEMTGVKLVRWRVTPDKLQMLDTVQFSNPLNPNATNGDPGTGDANYTGVTETVVNAWPITNVDLKYRVNLDGEKSNFYEENQELDWQVRQWVKLTFDKNDFSDFAPMDFTQIDMINKCGDVAEASTTLVDGSFNVEGAGDSDPSNDYFEFTVQVAVPMIFNDTTCLTSYGPMLANALRIGKTSVTVNLKYSFKRATPTAQLTYKPWAIDEKDPIHHKYGPFLWTVWNRDPETQLIAAQQLVNRFDPAKPIVWYFDKGFPEYYKPYFMGTGGNPGIMQATNTVLQASGAAARVQFLNYNDGTAYQDKAGPVREFGDVRYNFLRWESDQDLQDSFAGVTMPAADPRTGEMVNEGIVYNDFAVKDYFAQRIDAFLQTIGASQGLNNPGSWQTGSCTTGQTAQIVNQTVIDNHNANSTLYTKMQSYLNLNGPDPTDNHLGPQDFVATQDADFYRAFYALAPYELFADPDMNQFVTREGGQGVYGPAGLWNALQQETQFQQMTAQINNGTIAQWADGATGVQAAAAFAQSMKAATVGHQQLQLIESVAHPDQRRDVPGAFSLETVMEQDAQACVNGQWETPAQWTQHILDTYWQQVLWHEFGHSMGLEHNFMGNLDQPNFVAQRDSSGKALTDQNGNTIYQMYSNSIMEYNAAPARLAWTQGWGTYDKGAIAWIYGNNGKQPDDAGKDATLAQSKPLSGQIAGASVGQEYPYKDPYGFCQPNEPDCTAGNERAFMRCDETYMTYSPMCRQGDLGVTPSQIVANSIDGYEWQYQWRNFRDYRKVWDNSAYANAVAGFIVDQNRFLSQWIFDWNPGEIQTLLYRVGVTPPANAPSAVDYYSQLTYKFLVEMTKANDMVAAFDEAIIQQAAGERPYATVYDTFYGDTTQQGIILDKYFAMQNFVGLWNSTNYDQNQAGAYISSWGDFDFDDTYQSIAETAVASMIGTQYAVYPYFIPTAVALFANDTHNPAFLGGGGRTEAKDWIGGWTFPDIGFMNDFFKQIAVTHHLCTSVSACNYDVTDPTQVALDPSDHHFIGPDGLTYIYALIPSRNEYVLAREDRNIATYKQIQTYNVDIILNNDDGSNGTYSLEYAIKYTLDAYDFFENGNSSYWPQPTATASQ